MRSVQVSAAATPSRSVGRRSKPKDRDSGNRWERGIPTDERGMPYLDAHGTKVGNKKFSETRRNYRR